MDGKKSSFTEAGGSSLRHLKVGYIRSGISDPAYLTKEELLTGDSYGDRWMGALQRAGIPSVMYVPFPGIDKPVSRIHRFGHLVKLVPTCSVLSPSILSRTRKMTIVGLESPFHRIEMLGFTLNLLKEAIVDNIDILHYEACYATSFALSPILSILRPVVVWYTGGDLPVDRMSKWTWYFALRLAFLRARLVMTGAFRDRVRNLRWAVQNDDKIRFIEVHRVDRGLFRLTSKADARASLGWDKDSLYLISVFSIIPDLHSVIDQRNPYLMIDVLAATAEMIGVRARLVVIGSGPGLEVLRGYCQKAGLGDNVSFVGRVEHDKLPRYFAAADLVFVPYRMESLNDTNVLAESFSCGRPGIVFKRTASTPDESPGGFLIPTDVPDAARKLASILADESNLDRKSREAFENSKNFDLATAASDLLGFYREALQ